MLSPTGRAPTGRAKTGTERTEIASAVALISLKFILVSSVDSNYGGVSSKVATRIPKTFLENMTFQCWWSYGVGCQ
jgi:hypothetical protein